MSTSNPQIQVLGKCDDTCIITHTNTKYPNQNDSHAIITAANTIATSPIDWAKITASIQANIYKEIGAINGQIVETFTTMALAHIRGSRITTANLGDSRVGFVKVDPRKGSITYQRITQDQTSGTASVLERIRNFSNVFQDDDETSITEFAFANGNLREFKIGPVGGIGNHFSGNWFRRTPDIKQYNIPKTQSLRRGAWDAFIVAETDGSHLELPDHYRTHFLREDFGTKRGMRLTAEQLAKHFTDQALKLESDDNITVIVQKLGLTEPQSSSVLAVFDGAGKNGSIISNPAAQLLKSHMENPPIDENRQVQETEILAELEAYKKQHPIETVVDAALLSILDRVFGIDLS